MAVPNLPKIPLGVLIGGLGATAGVASLGYLAYGSIYSGARSAPHLAPTGRRPQSRLPAAAAPSPSRSQARRARNRL